MDPKTEKAGNGRVYHIYSIFFCIHFVLSSYRHNVQTRYIWVKMIFIEHPNIYMVMINVFIRGGGLKSPFHQHFFSNFTTQKHSQIRGLNHIFDEILTNLGQKLKSRSSLNVNHQITNFLWPKSPNHQLFLG